MPQRSRVPDSNFSNSYNLEGKTQQIRSKSFSSSSEMFLFSLLKRLLSVIMLQNTHRNVSRQLSFSRRRRCPAPAYKLPALLNSSFSDNYICGSL